MYDEATGALVLTGRTMHCFTNAQGRPIQLKKQFPDLDRVLHELADAYRQETAAQDV